MSDFVLVHGAWHGAWCWKRLRPLLQAAGHRVFTPTLSGLGERAHQLGQDIRLATHVQDVCAVLEAEELTSAILVGHSYGGMVITGVADRMPERLAQLVYLDAVVPLSGEAWSSRHPEATRQQRREAIAREGCIPPAAPSAFGLNGDDAAWVERRQTPQPGGVYDDPLVFDTARWSRMPRRFVDCTDPALPTVAIARERVRSQSGWLVEEIATGHDAMISAPEALARILLGWAAQASGR